MAGIGGTVADVLDVCKLLNNELKIDAGGRDEARMIRALTQSQHYLETLASRVARALETTLNVTTAAATEATAKSSSIRRIDGYWLLDASGRPIRELYSIQDVGGHAPDLPWPFLISPASAGINTTGAPIGLYASWDQFYWLPLPDQSYIIRIHGLFEQARFLLRTDDYNYPYFTHLPLATFAIKLQRVGLDDDIQTFDALAAQTFLPMLQSLSNTDRSAPEPRHYSQVHTT